MTLMRYDNDKPSLDIAYDVGRDKIAPILANHISGQPLAKPQELQLLVRGATTSEFREAIDNSLDVIVPYENGKRALGYANELGNQEVVDILIANGATPELNWPAIKTESSPYPQNFPETWSNGPVIAGQHVAGGQLGILALGYITYLQSYFLRLQYLDKRVRLPVQSIIFESFPRD
ncbi:hypothetical protein F5Y11DRAFT_271582 [Daldinia sp. FL1419]|nr:hypothetical protein F5Y11DRAFT_271582 [Daldinia sp. FL1419]